MTESELIAKLSERVKADVHSCLSNAQLEEISSVIAEGSWQDFRHYCLERARTDFGRRLRARLDQAIAQGRLNAPSADTAVPLHSLPSSAPNPPHLVKAA